MVCVGWLLCLVALFGWLVGWLKWFVLVGCSVWLFVLVGGDASHFAMLFFLVCVCAGQKAFSYNTDVSVCTRAPGGPNKCCALKSSIPASQPSHFKPGQVTTGYKYEPPAGIPHPSARQQEYMDMGLTQFMHFSVTTFGNIEVVGQVRNVSNYSSLKLHIIRPRPPKK